MRPPAVALLGEPAVVRGAREDHTNACDTRPNPAERLLRAPGRCDWNRSCTNDKSTELPKTVHRLHLMLDRSVILLTHGFVPESRHAFTISSSRVHAHRIAGGDRDHCDPHRPVAARCAASPRSGPPHAMPQQHEAVGPRGSQLSRQFHAVPDRRAIAGIPHELAVRHPAVPRSGADVQPLRHRLPQHDTRRSRWLRFGRR